MLPVMDHILINWALAVKGCDQKKHLRNFKVSEDRFYCHCIHAIYIYF